MGARNGKDGSSANDYCYVKLRLIKTIPSFLKSFPVLYSFGLLNADGGIDFKTETFKTLSTDLIRISGNDVEFFNRSKLKANKNQVIVEDTVTVVCQVRKQLHPITFDSSMTNLISDHYWKHD